MKTTLVIIDGQLDFLEGGTLPVGGGTEAVKNIAKLVDRLSPQINEINATLDSHHELHIAHKWLWLDSHGNHPKSFPGETLTPTIITEADMISGKWRAVHPDLEVRFQNYLHDLEAKNRFPHLIWTEHCLIGSKGHSIHPTLRDSLGDWTTKRLKTVEYVTKGSNPFSEHFSAIKAEVPDPNDLANTGLNIKMIERIQKFSGDEDRILWTGIAGSHCLNYTLRDAAEELGDEFVKRFVLLEDCTSPVQGFEQSQEDLFTFVKSKGGTVCKSTDL
jgi:nicotinamidase/pyrazinamidase